MGMGGTTPLPQSEALQIAMVGMTLAAMVDDPPWCHLPAT
jgi:hypothetical protein